MLAGRIDWPKAKVLADGITGLDPETARTVTSRLLPTRPSAPPANCGPGWPTWSSWPTPTPPGAATGTASKADASNTAAKTTAPPG